MPIWTKAVAGGVRSCCINSGQSCNAPTRMFVPRAQHDEAMAIAKPRREASVGDPAPRARRIGPVVSEVQFDKIQAPDQDRASTKARRWSPAARPAGGLNRGYYVRPTVFADVTPRHDDRAGGDLRPVLSILPYDTGSSDRASPTTRLRPFRLCAVGRYRACARGRRAAAHRQCASERRRPDFARRSAATSSRATAANGASSASRNSSRPRRSSATR